MPKKDEGNQKQRFLNWEFLTSSINASMQTRAGGSIYRERKDNEDQGEYNKQKEIFRKSFGQELDNIVTDRGYRTLYNVTQEEHAKNISTLADTLTERHCDILRNGRFRIGSAQKGLNLYLKYLWCAGEIIAPPHCPIDGGLIVKLGSAFRGNSWTQIDDIEQYKKVIAAAQNKGKKEAKSLAEWELHYWNDENVKY